MFQLSQSRNYQSMDKVLRQGFFLLGLVSLTLFSACTEETPPRPPLELPVVEVIVRDQPIELEMVGQTRGSSEVSIRARVDGFINSMDFIEGSTISKGDLLYTIDDVPFQTSVVEAKGKLAEVQTTFARATSDLDRIRPLAEMKAVSQMDLDSAIAEYNAAIGALQAANAQLKQADILLGYCRISSPINGLIGISNVDVGEYVGGGLNGLLNTVSKVNPIRVRFAIDEKDYLKFARKFIAASKSEDGTSHSIKPGEFILILADGSIHKHTGRIVTRNAAVDPTTGTFTVEADFSNPDRLVLSGQYARVRTIVEIHKNAILVPQRSIVELQSIFSVFVVNAQGVVEQRKVQVGPKIHKLQIINSGLKPGEHIVLEGVQKVKNGMSIKPITTLFDEATSSTSVSTSTNSPEA